MEFRSEKEIFFAALEQTTPEARNGFLDGVCSGEGELRQRVEKLLVDHFGADSFMHAAAVNGNVGEVSSATMVEGPGSRIGRYKLLQKLGEGGFGIVYMAEQKDPVKRRVALKIIKLGMDTKQVVARFEAERQALAMMDHPHIAKVLDGGATESGRPYFVMELVKGIPITRYCDNNNLTTKERLELFIPVCRSIQHAHQKGIIHRDIKPSNVMITLHDGQPVPKVIDFGIAKATQQELTEKTLFTQYSQFIGTPAYMSPEQAEMSGLDVDTRTDIYSLGVLLYELLVGRTPLDAKELMSGGYDEIRKRILEQEPPKLSTRLSTIGGEERTVIAIHRSIGPNQLSSEMRGDLDWIVLKSLEKDRTRRYETATGFAADIQRFLKDEPVLAVAPSVIYKFRKLVRRNKLVFGAVAAVSLALVLGLTAALVSYSRERAAHDESDTSRSVAVAARKEADKQRLDALRLKEEAESLSEARRREAYQSDMVLASQAYHTGNIDRMNELVEKHWTEPASGEKDLRGFEWYHWWKAGRLALLSFPAPQGGFHGYQYSRGLPVFAVSGWKHWLEIHEASAGMKELVHVETDNIHAPFSFTPDGTALVIGNIRQGGIRVLEGEHWTSRTFRAPGDDGIRCLAFAQPREMMATGGNGEHIVLWNSSTWEPVGAKIPVGGDVWDLAFSPDGNAILVAMGNATVVVWNVTNAANPIVQHIMKGHGKRVTCVARCPSADFFATGSTDKTVRLWSKDYELIGTYDATGPVTILRFSPDGTRLLAGTRENNSVLVWSVRADPTSLELVHNIKGHAREITGADFDPGAESANHMVSVSWEGKAKIWDLERCEPYTTLDQLPNANRICFGEGGKVLMIANRQGKVHRWDFENREPIVPSPQPDEFQTLALSGRGTVRAGLGKDGFVSVWDSSAGEIQKSPETIDAGDPVFNVRHDDALEPSMMTLSGDGSTVAWMTEEGVHVWNRVKEQLMHLPLGNSEEYLPRYAGDLHLPTLSFNGERLLMTGTEDRHFSELWNISDDVPVLVWPGRVRGWGPERGAAFSRDGKLLAIGSFDTHVRIYDTESGVLQKILKGHSNAIRGLSFSKDGTRLASDDEDGKLCLWDVETGGLLTTLQGFQGESGTVVWSQNGDAIASLGQEGKLRVWIMATRQEAVDEFEKFSASRNKPDNAILLNAFTPAVRQVLVPPVSRWRWLHPLDGIDPAEIDDDFHTTFCNSDYDDSSWETGLEIKGTKGGFGYGDEWFEGVDIGTPVSRDLGHAAYFRCRFTTSKSHANLELRCQRDDGIIVYIDGKEVGRDNMSPGEEAYQLPAASTISGGHERRASRITLVHELPAGDHVLAISLHNTKNPSSDLRIGRISLVEVEAGN